MYFFVAPELPNPRDPGLGCAILDLLWIVFHGPVPQYLARANRESIPQKMTLRVGTVLAWTAALDFAHKRELRC